MQKIDLTDVTFLIPVRIDSPERLENLKLTVQFLNSYLDTSVLALEADLKEQVQIPEGVRKWFVKDHDPVFHRTRYLNQMTRQVTSPYLAIWDADVIGIPSQLEAAVNLLREGKADMVFPYEKYFYAVPKLFKELYVNNNYRLDILEKGKEYMGYMPGDWPVGGAFLVNRQAYMEAGMENEHFYGWGPEDAERVVRWDTLGYRIKRVDGPLFHLPHPRKSWYDSKETEIRNRGEFLRICAMDPPQLKKYIGDAEWVLLEHKNTFQ